MLAAAGLALGAAGGTVAAFSSSTSSQGSFSAAASFCSAPAETVWAGRDTWLDERNPQTSYGSDTSLVVRSWAVGAGARNGRALVGFPLPPAPAGCSVASATLTLTASGSGAGRTIEVYRAGGAWTEATTWSTQPALAGAAASAPSVADGPFAVDVTAQAQALYAGTDHGFLLKDAAEGSQGASVTQTWSAREAGADPPTLRITWG